MGINTYFPPLINIYQAIKKMPIPIIYYVILYSNISKKKLHEAALIFNSGLIQKNQVRFQKPEIC